MSQRLQSFLQPVSGMRWSVSDVAMWADSLQSDRVLHHGIKASLRQDSEDHGDDLFTEHNVWQTFKDPGPVQKMLRGEVSTRDMLTWYQKNLLEAKHGPTKFPAEVIRQNGLDAVTKPPRLYVGTIHSFKGSEADIVFIYPDLSYRGMCSWAQGGDGYNEIIRMFYVALTRAKQGLYICEPVGDRSVPLWEYV